MKIVTLWVSIALLLAGCAGELPSPTDTNAVCKALVGPLKYNTYKPASSRFAGPALAKDLSVRNKVGQNLRCPAYKG
jgi:hypothetical protein